MNRGAVVLVLEVAASVAAVAIAAYLVASVLVHALVPQIGANP